MIWSGNGSDRSRKHETTVRRTFTVERKDVHSLLRGEGRTERGLDALRNTGLLSGRAIQDRINHQSSRHGTRAHLLREIFCDLLGRAIQIQITYGNRLRGRRWL